MQPPILSGSVWIPKHLERKEVTKDLTIEMYNVVSEEVSHVKLFQRTRLGIHVPRQYGLDYLKRIGAEPPKDQTAPGRKVTFPKQVLLYDYQEPFVNAICDRRYKWNDTVAEAATGKGKTVMSLAAICRIGVTALVVVDQEFIKTQWVNQAKKFLGLKDEDIGYLQGKKCDYEGKKLVIGMIQSLYNREYEEEVYRYFGVVVFDEVHTAGAEQFSKVLMQFSAEYRFGVSATPDRTDALQKALTYNLGKVTVSLGHKHEMSHVRYVLYDGVTSFYANVSPKAGRFLTELISDPYRNDLLSDMLIAFYKQGRDVLAISDRIEQLDTVMALCQIKGISAAEMGIVAGYEMVWKYAKDATPSSKPEGWVKGTEYTPVCVQQVKKRVPREVLEERKGAVRILFSTYGMFGKAVDVPRLSAGVDMTPRSKAKQVHGRILRPSDGKLIPIWGTVRDFMSYRAEYQFSNRLTEYAEGSVEIYQWHLEKGVRKTQTADLRKRVNARVRKLKLAKISMRRDGNNIVIM